MIASIDYLGATWAERMAADIAGALDHILITTLSIQKPTQMVHGSYAKLYQSLLDAAKAGVETHLYLPASHKSHPATLKNNGMANELAKAGVQVHQIRVSHLLHAKTCVIDNKISYIGSGNWTAAAANHNHEGYIRAVCEKLALDIKARWELLA